MRFLAVAFVLSLSGCCCAPCAKKPAASAPIVFTHTHPPLCPQGTVLHQRPTSEYVCFDPVGHTWHYPEVSQ